MVEILALQGSFCLPAKVFLNFAGRLLYKSNLLILLFAPNSYATTTYRYIAAPVLPVSVRSRNAYTAKPSRSRSLNVGDIDLDLLYCTTTPRNHHHSITASLQTFYRCRWHPIIAIIPPRSTRSGSPQFPGPIASQRRLGRKTFIHTPIELSICDKDVGAIDCN